MSFHSEQILLLQIPQVWVGAGFCAFVLQVFALVDFFMKISFKNRATNNGVDDKTSSYTQTLKKLNENKEVSDDLLELLLAAIRLRCDHTEFIFELIRRGERPAGRAELLANSGRRGIGRFPRKCKLRGPPRVTCGVRVHFAGA